MAQMNKSNLQERVAKLEEQLQAKNNEIEKLNLKLSQFEDNKSSAKPDSTLGSKH